MSATMESWALGILPVSVSWVSGSPVLESSLLVHVSGMTGPEGELEPDPRSPNTNLYPEQRLSYYDIHLRLRNILE